PAFRRFLRRHPVIMMVLGLAVLSQTGCKSDPCSGFGACGSRMKNLSERAFRPIRNAVNGSGKCCGGDLGVEAAPGVQYGYGTPAVVSPTPYSGPSSS